MRKQLVLPVSSASLFKKDAFCIPPAVARCIQKSYNFHISEIVMFIEKSTFSNSAGPLFPTSERIDDYGNLPDSLCYPFPVHGKVSNDSSVSSVHVKELKRLPAHYSCAADVPAAGRSRFASGICRLVAEALTGADFVAAAAGTPTRSYNSA